MKTTMRDVQKAHAFPPAVFHFKTVGDFDMDVAVRRIAEIKVFSEQDSDSCYLFAKIKRTRLFSRFEALRDESRINFLSRKYGAHTQFEDAIAQFILDCAKEADVVFVPHRLDFYRRCGTYVFEYHEATHNLRCFRKENVVERVEIEHPFCNLQLDEQLALLNKMGAKPSAYYGGINTVNGYYRYVDYILFGDYLEGEGRPKNTDEVDGSSQSGNETHGGDGASQEVPDGRSKGGDKEAADREANSKELKKAKKNIKRVLNSQTLPGGVGGGTESTITNKPDPKTVARVRALFEQLTIGHLQEINKKDYNDFVIRYATKRNVFNTRKLEDDKRPVLLVIADISGSCVQFAKPACAVASAIGALSEVNIVVVAVHNVFDIQDMWINGKKVNPSPYKQNAGRYGDIEYFVKKVEHLVGKIELAVGIGDTDEINTYTYLWTYIVYKFVWLDNYLCSKYQPFTARRIRGYEIAPENVLYIAACGDVNGMIRGLELAVGSM